MRSLYASHPGLDEGLITIQHSYAPPRVWGAAYRIPPEHVAEMKEYLDIREINGYSIQYAPFHVSPSWLKGQQSSELHHIFQQDTPSIGAEAGTVSCLVYIGLPENPQFLGPQDPQLLAEKITRSKGPSGENVEYLLMLEKALVELSDESGDDHVSDLASRCRAILAERNINQPLVDEEQDTDGREEVEKSSDCA